MFNYIKEKENKIVAKIKNPDGSFKRSVIIPTDYYPLNSEKYKVFHYKNTEQICDEKMINVIDRVDYKIGCCYQNTKEIVRQLKSEGFDVRPYVGWLFVGESQFPVHHCWAVVNGIHVVDLADDFTMMLKGDNAENFKELNIQQTRVAMASFVAEARKQKNSIRCYPMGTPTPFLYYIGAECSPDDGKRIYQGLIKTHPEHECQRNCDSSGLNPTQKTLKEQGLM